MKKANKRGKYFIAVELSPEDYAAFEDGRHEMRMDKSDYIRHLIRAGNGERRRKNDE